MTKITSEEFLVALVDAQEINNISVHKAFVKFMKSGGKEPLPTFKAKFNSARSGELIHEAPKKEEVIVEIEDTVSQVVEDPKAVETVTEEFKIVAPELTTEDKELLEEAPVTKEAPDVAKVYPIEEKIVEVLDTMEEEVVDSTRPLVEEIISPAVTITSDETPKDEKNLADADLRSEMKTVVEPKTTKVDSSNVATRVIKNYRNGDKAPDMPGLMPTGTKFDSVVSDRITSKKELEEYMDMYGEDMPDDMREIGGFTRKCVDITAGKSGK